MLCRMQAFSLQQRATCRAPAAGARLGFGWQAGTLLSQGKAATRSVVVAGSKKDLAQQIEDTQKTLAKVVEAVDAANAPAAVVQGAGEAPPSMLSAREQQLWDRQQALLDRELKRWDEERQAWRAREADLLDELSDMRQEMRQLLAAQQQMLLQLPNLAQANVLSGGASNVPADAVIDNPIATAGSSTSIAPSTPSQANSGSPAWAQLFEGGGGASAQGSSSVSTQSNSSPASATSSSTASSPATAAPSNSFADSFKAAFAAVNEIDILNQDVDFNRIRQQASAAGPASSSVSSLSAQPGSTAQQQEGETAVEPVRGHPDGPAPVLAVGDDDIYWVAKLHEGLLREGYYPDDEAVENWLFEESTQTALLTYQACNGLNETGVADEPTWEKLLGTNAPSPATSSSSSNNAASSFAALAPPAPPAPPAPAAASSSAPDASAAAAVRTKWPVVMDTDGGREVHVLQLALGRAGYACGDDEMRWWMFGDMTSGALKTFQACNGLPESGVCDERTWRALLGQDALPSVIDEPHAIASSDEFEEDMTSMPAPGAVWLLGEQRWAMPMGPQ